MFAEAAPFLQLPGAIFNGGYYVRSVDGGKPGRGCVKHIAPKSRDPYGQRAGLQPRRIAEGRTADFLGLCATDRSRRARPPRTCSFRGQGLTWKYSCLVVVDANASFNETRSTKREGGQAFRARRTSTTGARALDRRGSFQAWQGMGFQGHPPHALRLPDNRVLLTYGYRRATRHPGAYPQCGVHRLRHRARDRPARRRRIERPRLPLVRADGREARARDLLLQRRRWHPPHRRHNSGNPVTAARSCPPRPIAVILFVSCRLSKDTAHRLMRVFGLQPHRSKACTLFADPLFMEKVRDIVGLCLAPPAQALPPSDALPPVYGTSGIFCGTRTDRRLTALSHEENCRRARACAIRRRPGCRLPRQAGWPLENPSPARPHENPVSCMKSVASDPFVALCWEFSARRGKQMRAQTAPPTYTARAAHSSKPRYYFNAERATSAAAARTRPPARVLICAKRTPRSVSL